MASEFALPTAEFPSKYKVAQIPSICSTGFYLPVSNLSLLLESYFLICSEAQILSFL